MVEALIFKKKKEKQTNILDLIFALSNPLFMQSPTAAGEVQPTWAGCGNSCSLAVSMHHPEV